MYVAPVQCCCLAIILCHLPAEIFHDPGVMSCTNISLCLTVPLTVIVTASTSQHLFVAILLVDRQELSYGRVTARCMIGDFKGVGHFEAIF